MGQVNFEDVFADLIYCPKCKNFKVLETDEPCNECLTECAREGTVKPVKFEEAKVKIK